jgi:hypothetical protein
MCLLDMVNTYVVGSHKVRNTAVHSAPSKLGRRAGAATMKLSKSETTSCGNS